MMGGLKPSSDNITGNTGADQIQSEETEEEKAFRETFEKILASTKSGGGNLDSGGDPELDLEELSRLMNGLGGAGLPGVKSGDKQKPKSTATPSSQQQSFQDTIKATITKLAESEAQHKSRSTTSDDPLAALMAQMEAMGGAGGFPGLDALGKGGDDGQDLPELLDGLMVQLMSKELLYEPISELKTKYPEYLASGEAAKITADERQRYEKQGEIVKQIFALFEDPNYDDTDKETRSKVSKLMQEMQDCGVPPKELLGELGPAMALNADGTPNISPDACVIA